MANIDKVSVKNTVYNIVSPAVVSDYIEVIGGACTKPDGYEEDEVILAKQNDVQLLFKATQNIAFGANIVENTNCVRTTLEEVLKNAGGGGGASSADQVSYDNSDSGLEAENVQEAVDELATNAGTASSQIQTLTNKVANEIATRAKLGGHNLLDYAITSGSENGLTITANADKSFTITSNGSATTGQVYYMHLADFKLPKGTYVFENAKTGGGSVGVGVEGGDYYVTYLSGVNGSGTWYSSNATSAQRTFTVTDETQVISLGLYVSSGTTVAETTFYPMIRLATDESADYEPYARTNQELTGEVVPMLNVLGAKNLVPYPYHTNSETINGITWTVNSDGSVTANGTATALSIFDAINTELYADFSLDEGNYILSDDLTASDYNNAYSAITLQYLDGTVEYNHADTSIGKNAFSMPAKSQIKNFYLGLVIKSGATVSNLVFKPMIRLASIQDGTYVPYAKTNLELTEDLKNLYKLIGSHTFSATHDGTKTWNTLAHECLEQMKTYLSNNHDRAFMLRSITLKAVASIPLTKPQIMNYATSDHSSSGFVLRTNANGASGYDINLYDNSTKIALLSFTTAPAFSVNNTWGENTVATNGVDLILDEYVLLS